MHFRYGGLLCVFLSLWNSYRSLVHRGKEPSPNICVYRQMCDGGVGGLRHLFILEESLFLITSFSCSRAVLGAEFIEQSFCANVANAFWSWILARLDRVSAVRARVSVRCSRQKIEPFKHNLLNSILIFMTSLLVATRAPRGYIAAACSSPRLRL